MNNDDFLDELGDLEDFHDGPAAVPAALLGSIPKPQRELHVEGAPSNRFYCAGFKRKDEDGKPFCTYRAPRRWPDRCPSCNNPYNCLPISKKKESTVRKGQIMTSFDATVGMKAREFIPCGIEQIDKVLGGGALLGNNTLLGGERGKGKTTLLLQMAQGWAERGYVVLVVSGEMTGQAIMEYGLRLGTNHKNVKLFGDTRGLDVDDIIERCMACGARILILDSLQVTQDSEVKADVGDPAQVDAVTNRITSFCGEKSVASFTVSHLTKSGDYAGTETSQHLWDVLLRFEGAQFFYPSGPNEGYPIEGTEKRLRKIYLAEKSRQGDDTVAALLEMKKGGAGLQPVNDLLYRKLKRLGLLDEYEGD